MEFTVKVFERVDRMAQIRVSAKSLEEAREIAQEQYYAGDLTNDLKEIDWTITDTFAEPLPDQGVAICMDCGEMFPLSEGVDEPEDGFYCNSCHAQYR